MLEWNTESRKNFEELFDIAYNFGWYDEMY